MSDQAHGTPIREHVLLFSRFLRNPRAVGAVTASSRALARSMLRDLDVTSPGRVVELGPGTGVITAAIVERLGPKTEFLALDIDPEFVARVKARWPHVRCLCGSAERLDAIAADWDMLPLDHVISGLPFVSLPPPVTERITNNIVSALRPAGSFTTFQYVTGYSFPSARAFRRNMSARMGRQPAVRLELRNMPPVFVLTWKKAALER